MGVVNCREFPSWMTTKNKEKESEITCILFLQTIHLLKRNQYCYIASLLIIICLSINIHLTTGADIMYPNQSLSGDQTLVSSGEIFELGFFKPGNSSNYYIGMWYKKLSFRTIVWVANRETPISDRYSAELKIKDGNLVLLNESKTPVWSTNSNVSSSSSIVVVLLDDGNLVLREGSSSNPPIWQSSDHPTNTLLPGNKLAYNKLTRTKHVLTSWKSSNDPAKGRFSLEVDPNGSQCLLKWNMSEQYWSTGTWNGNLFSLLPEMRSQDVYTYHYISNENESYLTYSVNYNLSIMSRFVLDVSGQLKLKQLNWLKNRQDWDLLWSQPEKQCQVYGFCGAFGVCDEDSQTLCDCLGGFKPWSEIDWNISDYSDGCVRKTNLQCGNTSKAIGEKYGFLMSFSSLGSSNHYLNVPIKNTAFVDARNRTGCETTCLETCSCNAYAYDRNGCWIWSGEVVNLKERSANDVTQGTIYVKLASSDIPILRMKTKLFAGTIQAITILVVLLLCSIGYVSYRRMSRRRRVGAFHAARDDAMEAMRFIEDNKDIDVPFFEFKNIMAATNNFSEANKLGQGGFGPVYKGKLPGGVEIAVKRLSSYSGQGLAEFRNEVMLIAKLQHRNLVRLLGYSMKGNEKMLVYEYMLNKSLDTFVFDQTYCMLLDWKKRMHIILGIARGLLYLHHDSRLRIIHRDLKTSNILLDEEMNPKISDFGLARIVGGKETEGSTKRVIGTFGYMSPEYLLDGLFSVKSDVFSFGVVVLEIISGKRNSGFYQSQQATSHLLGYTWGLWKEEKALDIMDETISADSSTSSSSEVLKCIKIALLCVQEDPIDRPTMANVVFMLGGDIASLPNPKQPALFARKRFSGPPVSFRSEHEAQSVNDLTMSVVEGR